MKFKIDPKTFRIVMTDEDDEEDEDDLLNPLKEVKTPRNDPHLLTIQIPPKSHK